MTPQPLTNHVRIESLEALPTDAASTGSIALVHGEPDSIPPAQLTKLSSEFVYIHFVENVDAIDFSGVGNITSITKFAAVGFGLDTDHALSFASYLTELEVLYLDDNRIAAAGLRALSELESLTSLHVANNGVGRGVASLAELWQLTDLDISRNSLGGKKFLAIGELGNLECLTADSCHIYAKNLHVLTQLPKLKSLSIAENNLGDEAAELLCGLTSLTELNVAGNNLSDRALDSLRDLPNLMDLRFE